MLELQSQATTCGALGQEACGQEELVVRGDEPKHIYAKYGHAYAWAYACKNRTGIYHGRRHDHRCVFKSRHACMQCRCTYSNAQVCGAVRLDQEA